MNDIMTTKMTPHQVELARHALGLNRNKISYRNYFSVGVGAPDYDQWQQMVRQGNAFRWTGPVKAGTMFGGDDVFHLTRRGANAVLRDGESLDQKDFPQRPRLTMSLSEKIRETTRLMAERASSPMELWDEHSNACLEAATALEQMAALIDPAICRLQFPDGHVPGNAKEAAEGWKKWADHFRDEFEKIKRNQNPSLAGAVEFGYKACEQGNNLQRAVDRFFNGDCILPARPMPCAEVER